MTVKRTAKWWQPELRPPGRREQRLMERFAGPPPERGASAAARLRFVRRINVRSMLVLAPPLVILAAAYGASTWWSVLMCLVLVLGLANILDYTRKIREAERADRNAR